MADAIDFSKTQRIVLLVDLNPFLSQFPNPNYITSILATSNILLSPPPLSSSLFSFKLFFSSLSSLDSVSTLRHLLPSYSSASVSFNSPSQTLDSLSHTLNSISSTKLTYSPSNASHIASSLLQLARDYGWEFDIENLPGKIHSDPIDVRSNLVILLSPVCRSLKSLAEFVSVDVDNDCLMNLDVYGAKFRDCFGAVNDAFNSKDIHFCWVDIHSHEEEEAKNNKSEKQSAIIGNEIRKFGWGFCSADSIVLGSALVSFGLIYPVIGISSKLLDSPKLDKRIRGQLSLEILDVHGKPIEWKCCDLNLLHLKASSKPSSKAEVVNSVSTFLGNLNNGIMKLHITSVHKYTVCEKLEEFSSDHFLVQSAKSAKKEKDGLDIFLADKVLEQLASEKSEFFEKHSVPTWQILLSFLYSKGYWALLSISNNNGDSHTGILKPFTVHSAVLLFLDHNNALVQKDGGSNLLIENKLSQGDFDSQKGTSPSGKYVHLAGGKRRKIKKHTHRDLTWSAFCKAAYELLDVDLTEVYFANGLKKSKKLKFLKCWMTEVKNKSLSSNNIPDRSCKMGPDSIQQKETDVNEDISASHQESDGPLTLAISSQQSRIQGDADFESCSETPEAFFSSLPKRIQEGLESDGVDLKIMAESFVNSSIYWLSQKQKNMENLDESCSAQVAEIIQLLLTEPKDLKEHKDNDPSSTSKYLVKEYELQILLRMEILQSEYAGSMKGSLKTKLVKQICSLLEIFQYLVEGGFHGDISLYAYVEKTIKTRYSQNLEDVVKKIYDEMDLLPFGEENEDQGMMLNSEDSSHEMAAANKMMIHDSLFLEDEPSHPPVDNFDLGDTEKDDEQKLIEARERRERAKRFVSTGRKPDLQRVWAPKPLQTTKVRPVSNKESKRKKQRRAGYSVVCETPMIGGGRDKKDERGGGSNSVYKALFQDDM
ncbi:unnamed protein product [Lactuca virosa]|uniref:Treslin N-terminal domain-containing protein n=1 Tax=Lactuca virosa TaxID=75947 RepID=A0AAU9NWV6_9ASTR|nr:unnamed protein product [Lactuca virosa]